MTLDGFHVYDTTLRDGAQQEGLSLSVHDKLQIAAHLDKLGVGYIEGGWPGSNPKDTEFFRRAKDELDLQHATLAAFGATRRPGMRAADDPLVAALRDSGATVVTLVAKSHDRHVELALRTTLEENLAMVTDTVTHLRSEGQRVFLDAEHFFNGYRDNRAYALAVLAAAAEAGAEVIALCDTNGGMLPPTRSVTSSTTSSAPPASASASTATTTRDARSPTASRPSPLAPPTSRAPSTATASAPGTPTWWPSWPTSSSRSAVNVLPVGHLRDATRIAHAIAEVTNVPSSSRQPYVGVSAFAHKAGLHASAIRVEPGLYQHTDPAELGNDMRMLVSEMAGRASIEMKGRELGYDLGGDPALVARVTDRVKELEATGYTFEAADASFELLLIEEVEGTRPSYFEVESWRVISESTPGGEAVSEATVKLRAGGDRIVVTGEGNGPVNALDAALRQAIGQAFPEVSKLELIDYKVRILDQGHGTDAVIRVLIETADETSALGDRRRRPQHRRGVLAGADRRGDVRPAPRQGADRLRMQPEQSSPR